MPQTGSETFIYATCLRVCVEVALLLNDFHAQGRHLTGGTWHVPTFASRYRSSVQYRIAPRPGSRLKTAVPAQ
jgi:hypothetical protein